jgi:hypothetical protein
MNNTNFYKIATEKYKNTNTSSSRTEVGDSTGGSPFITLFLSSIFQTLNVKQIHKSQKKNSENSRKNKKIKTNQQHF